MRCSSLHKSFIKLGEVLCQNEEVNQEGGITNANLRERWRHSRGTPREASCAPRGSRLSGAHPQVPEICLQVDEMDKYPIYLNVWRGELHSKVRLGEFGAEFMIISRKLGKRKKYQI